MCSSWSARICFVSKSSRPISVDLPSSTEPAVTSRSSSVSSIEREVAIGGLEVANALPVLHRGLADAVVGARLAPFGDPGRGDLADDLLDRRRLADDASGAAHVSDRAEPHRRPKRHLAGVAFDELGGGV